MSVMKLDDFKRRHSDDAKRPPLVLESPRELSSDDRIAFFEDSRDGLLELVSQSGAVLLRGLGRYDVDTNQSIMTVLGAGKTISYAGGGGADRHAVSKDLVTVTPSRPAVPIPLHNELSYTNAYPRYLAFFCRQAPESRGATSLADGASVFRSIQPRLRDRLQNHGVYYKRFMYDRPQRFKLGVRKSWQETFLTDDRASVESLLDSENIEYSWRNDGLHTRTWRPAFETHPVSAEPVWFNQIQMFEQHRPVLRLIGKAVFGFRDTGVEFGNRTPIEADSVRHICRVLGEHTVNEPWHNGDVMLVDNIACLHGRDSYRGERSILVGLFN